MVIAGEVLFTRMPIECVKRVQRGEREVEQERYKEHSHYHLDAPMGI